MRVALLAAWVLLMGAAQALPFGGGKEERTLSTTQYEIVVQRNGRIDVRTVAGRAAFHNAEPLVWFEGEDEAETLDLDGRRSMRQAVSDRLGRGQGLVLAGDDCQWQINAYISQPFFTVQTLYKNDTDSPVRVRALSPWSTGRRGGALRLGGSIRDARVLSLPSPFAQTTLETEQDTAVERSDFAMAVQPLSPAGVFVGGFLGAGDAIPRIRWGRTEEADYDEYGLYQAVCLYDPPVTVPPGETLSSEVFYVALHESGAGAALRRYSHALAAAALVAQGRREPMHGWDPLAAAGAESLDAAALLREAEAVARELRPYGWKWFHLPLNRGGGRGHEPDPGLYPDGLEPVARAIRAHDLLVALHAAPWADDAQLGGGGLPSQATDRLRDFTGDLRAWGVDGLVIREPMALALASSPPSGVTRVRRFNQEWSALAVLFHEPSRIAVAGGYPLPGLYARTGVQAAQTAPSFQFESGGALGFRGAAAQWARHWFFAPYLWAQSPGHAYFDRPALRRRWGVPPEHALTFEQSRAALTLAALSGGPVLFGNAPSDLTEAELDVLRRLLPGPSFPAQPLHPLYESPPAAWVVSEESGAGPFTIAAIVNWGEARETYRIMLSSLGLRAARAYAVYDFWADACLGLAQRDLSVTAPPGGVRVLGFRELKKRPFLLASNHHVLQGAAECGPVTWNAAERTLTGELDAAAGRRYGLRFYAPEGYEAAGVTWRGEAIAWGQTKRVVHTRIDAAADGPGAWTVRFRALGGETSPED